MNLLELFRPIRAFVFETDGVLTQETVAVNANGEFLYNISSRDVYALRTAAHHGYNIWIIADGDTEWLKNLQYPGINILQRNGSIEQKIFSISDHAHTLYMAGEIFSLSSMQTFALPTCPSDAVAEIKQAAKYISPYAGGKDCIRDVVEKVLKLNGHWQ
jgi:3-deoxy-D-manno-octulosonate 8-phosphate phosphatase (KDO 8-P phosphatase)